jgi:hypothetical protein
VTIRECKRGCLIDRNGVDSVVSFHHGPKLVLDRRRLPRPRRCLITKLSRGVDRFFVLRPCDENEGRNHPDKNKNADDDSSNQTSSEFSSELRRGVVVAKIGRGKKKTDFSASSDDNSNEISTGLKPVVSRSRGTTF